MIDHGLNWSQKNKIAKLAAEGYSPEAISRVTDISVRLVNNVINATPRFRSPINDSYGPLPGTPEWEELSSGAKSGLTRKRNSIKAAG